MAGSVESARLQVTQRQSNPSRNLSCVLSVCGIADSFLHNFILYAVGLMPEAPGEIIMIGVPGRDSGGGGNRGVILGQLAVQQQCLCIG
jgi:hypothetical protein